MVRGEWRIGAEPMWYWHAGETEKERARAEDVDGGEDEGLEERERPQDRRDERRGDAIREGLVVVGAGCGMAMSLSIQRVMVVAKGPVPSRSRPH